MEGAQFAQTTIIPKTISAPRTNAITPSKFYNFLENAQIAQRSNMLMMMVRYAFLMSVRL